MSEFNSIKKIAIFYVVPLVLWISLLTAIFDGWAGTNILTMLAIMIVSYVGFPFGLLIGLVAIGIGSIDEILENKKFHLFVSLLLLLSTIPTWFNYVPWIGSM